MSLLAKIFRRPDYRSDITNFISEMKEKRPDLEAQQRAGRALLWDKQVIRQRLAMRLAEVEAARALLFNTAWRDTRNENVVKEVSMLKALVRHPRQPLSRDKLAQLARGREFEPFDRSLDVQISRLRKMIEPDPAQPRYIQTVWGVGYVFVPDGAA